MAEVDLNLFQGVVIVSGDGLMHEFVNSVACGKIPVTHVPAGSGNAFAKTQTQLAEEECCDEVAIFLAVKGRIRQLNLVVHSFLVRKWNWRIRHSQSTPS